MKTPQSRPDYAELVTRIENGELTRSQAAELSLEITGLKPQTFLSWLRSSGATARLKSTRGNAGANSQFAHTDPAIISAYESALALALSGKVSIRQAAALHKVSYPYLLKKVRLAKGHSAENADADVVKLTKMLARSPEKRAALKKALAAWPS